MTREEAINAIKTWICPMRKNHKDNDFANEFIDAAWELAKAALHEPERKHGRWINSYPNIEQNPMFMYGICSECQFEQSISDKLNYCPNCGAIMDEE